MVRYLEKGEQIQVDISELEHFLLGTEDADISIRSLANNAQNKRNHSRFMLLDMSRGNGGGRGAQVLRWVMEYVISMEQIIYGTSKAKETPLVANVKQYAVMRAVHEKECQEHQKKRPSIT